MSNYSELDPIVPDGNIKRKKWREITMAGLALVSLLFEQFVYNVLVLKLIEMLNVIKWKSETLNILFSHFFSSIPLAYMGIFGGMLADFLISQLILAVFSYAAFIVGGVGLTIMINSANGNEWAQHYCNLTENNTQSDEIACQTFAYNVVFILISGNCLMIPILLVTTCNQIQKYGPKYVSTILSLAYIINEIAYVLSVIFAGFSNEVILSFFGIAWVMSFISFIIVLHCGEQNSGAITFRQFLNEIRKIYSSIFMKKRKSHRSKSKGDALQTANYHKSIRPGLYRLLTCIIPICLLSFPAFILGYLTKLINLQSLNMLQSSTDNITLGNSNTLMIQSPLAVNVGCILFGSIIVPCYILKFQKSNEVLSYAWRIVIGTLLTVITIYYCGIVEHFRLKMLWIDKDVAQYNIDGQVYNVAKMSPFLLIPSYFMFGFAMCLITMTICEYAFMHSPPWLRFTALGTAFLTASVGYLCAQPFIYGLDHTLYNLTNISGEICPVGNVTNLRSPCISHLDYVFYIAASSMLVLFGVILTITLMLRPNRFTLPFWSAVETQLEYQKVDEEEEI